MHRRLHCVGTMTAALTAGALALSGMGATIAAAAPHPQTPAVADTTPIILPTPQKVTWGGTDVPLSGDVAVVPTDTTPDPASLAAIEEMVTASGGTVVAEDAPAPDARIIIGTDDGAATGSALVPAGTEVPQETEGYTVTTMEAEVPTVVALGNDDDGAFYAIQTLRQMLQDGIVVGATVSDWPLMSIRGAIEGFYGIPWSHQSRLDMMRFSGEHKLNTYVYTPKDDRYLRAGWRDLYPEEDLAQIKEIVEAANTNHVDFVFALSPGNDVCYGSETDYQATIAKLDQLRSIGVRQFYIALDDIDPVVNCDSDRHQFPSRGPWTTLADAQSFYLNRIQNDYLKANDLPDLWMVPTNYYDTAPDPFKTAQGERLDPAIRVQWTGMGIFSETITVDQVTAASQTYNTEHLFIWDNFPVNDVPTNQVFLGTLTGRDPELYKHIDGFTSNPMIQPYASWLALASYGDYTWNGPAYDAEASWHAELATIVGDDSGTTWETMLAFTDLNQYWPYSSSSKRAPALSADLAAVDTALAGEDEEELRSAVATLQARLDLLKAAPETLKDINVPGFYTDLEGYINAAADWATATEHALAARLALRAGDGSTATTEMLAMNEAVASAKQPRLPTIDGSFTIVPDSKVPATGDGVFTTVTAQATAEWEQWAQLGSLNGQELTPVSASTTIGEYNPISGMIDDDDSTFWWSNSAGRTGASASIDLGSVQEIGRVVIEQGRSAEDSGDKFHHAVVEVSTDNATWTSLGEFHDQATITASVPQGTSARWVRIRAIGDNPDGRWVQIRDFQVFASGGEQSSTLVLSEGSSVEEAFDGHLATQLTIDSVPAEATISTALPQTTEGAVEVVVVGQVAATVQTRDTNGAWSDLGITDPTRSWNALPTSDPITGIRLTRIGANPLPTIVEIGYRPVGEVPSVEPSLESSPGSSVEPSPGDVPGGVMPAYVARVAELGNGVLLVGDWDGDGVLSWGVRVGTRVVFYDRNVLTAPVAASVSLGRAGDEVYVGDWDGDGADTVALRRGSLVFYQEELTSGAVVRGTSVSEQGPVGVVTDPLTGLEVVTDTP